MRIWKLTELLDHLLATDGFAFKDFCTWDRNKNTVPSLSVFVTFLLHESLKNRESLLAEGIEIEMKGKEKNKFFRKREEKEIHVIHPEKVDVFSIALKEPVVPGAPYSMV